MTAPQVAIWPKPVVRVGRVGPEPLPPLPPTVGQLSRRPRRRLLAGAR